MVRISADDLMLGATQTFFTLCTIDQFSSGNTAFDFIPARSSIVSFSNRSIATEARHAARTASSICHVGGWMAFVHPGDKTPCRASAAFSGVDFNQREKPLIGHSCAANFTK